VTKGKNKELILNERVRLLNYVEEKCVIILKTGYHPYV
jgi:hypothetical protein